MQCYIQQHTDLTVVKMKLLERVEEGGKERQGVEKEVREGGEWVVWLSFRAPSNHICIGNKVMVGMVGMVVMVVMMVKWW